MRTVRTMVVTLALAAAACDAAPAGPGLQPLQGTLTLAVSSGLAGADYAFKVTPNGEVVGIRCASLCAFQAGDTLQVLTSTQRSTLVDLVDASGITRLDADVEYPGRCCDYFFYGLTWSADGLTRTVKGPDATMPAAMVDLVHALALLPQSQVTAPPR